MAELSNEILLDRLNAAFPGEIENISAPYDMLTFEAGSEKVHPIIKFLKDDKDLCFGYLTDLCGTHYPEKKGAELGVIYHLHSLENNLRVRIKTYLPIEEPVLPTLTDLFLGANWMERETYDFYGIRFKGHPDLRRILNVDEMVAFPMRREHPLEDPNRSDKHDEFFGR